MTNLEENNDKSFISKMKEAEASTESSYLNFMEQLSDLTIDEILRYLIMFDCRLTRKQICNIWRELYNEDKSKHDEMMGKIYRLSKRITYSDYTPENLGDIEWIVFLSDNNKNRINMELNEPGDK